MLLYVLSALTVSVQARTPNIVNGENAEVGEFPWQASLQYRRGSHTCGASIIADRWLVSAAHCICPGVKNRKVVVGLHDRTTKRFGKPAEYWIEEVFAPEDSYCHTKKLKNDIVLLKVKEPMIMGQYVQPIDLPQQGERFTGSTCMISGWGRTGKGLANVLQKLQVTVVGTTGRKRCKHRDDRICITSEQGSACNGDSGGPLACKSEDKWVLVGDASYVAGGCKGDNIMGYGNVANFIDWIKETMAENDETIP